MLDAGLFGGIGKGSADGDLVSPVRRVDEGTLRALEQIVEKLAVLQAADVDGDIGQLGNLFCDEPVELFHLRPYVPSQGRGHANKARRLAAIAVDGDHRPLHAWLQKHWWAKEKEKKKRKRFGPVAVLDVVVGQSHPKSGGSCSEGVTRT